jgi:hypothetical protein
MTMPIKMTRQEVAEWILDILVKELKLKPGDVVPDQQLKQKYRARSGDSQNIPDGLQYAVDLEWLSYDVVTDKLHLTALGHEVA